MMNAMNTHETKSTPSLSSLIFSTAHTNFSHTLKSLSATKNSIGHRLRSIQHDAAFVRSVPALLGLDCSIPLVANARAGTWYIDPATKISNAYFKSTDGHYLSWSFSTRRLNLHLLPIIGSNGQALIVDSTRRGKVMPDALSKTIPIWCAVVNRVLFPESADSHSLVTSSQAVGASEHAQIEQRLPAFVEMLKKLDLAWKILRDQLQKPLRPAFVSPDMNIPTLDGLRNDWNLLILVSASRLESGDVDDGYVQGAADDAENWAMGLTAEIFWPEIDYLLNDQIGLVEVERRVTEVVTNTQRNEDTPNTIPSTGKDLRPAVLRLSTSSTPFYIVSIHELGRMATDDVDIRILCYTKSSISESEEGLPINEDEVSKRPPTLPLHFPPGKLGSRALRDALPRIATFITENSHKQGLRSPRILYACENGRDISLGVALAMVSLFSIDDGNIYVPAPSPSPPKQQDSCTPGVPRGTKQSEKLPIDKTFIRQRLVQIQSQMDAEGAGPSRSTLNAVNAFLMARPRWS